jgi:hypothetical protein
MTRARVAPLAIALTLASASPAGAQPAASISAASVSRADALFSEAKTLRDGGNYPAACAKFAESDRLAPGIGVALYLADCYDHVGKTASAWLSFRAAEARARERNDERAQIARDRAKALEPKLGRVTFVVARSLHRHGVEVWLDDAGPVPPADYSLGIAADLGDHVVALKLGGHTAYTVRAHVTGGGAATPVTLVEPPLPHVPPTFPGAESLRSDASGASPPMGTASASGDPRGAIELGLIALGGVGLVAGGGFLLAKNGSMTNRATSAGPSFDDGASAGSAIGFAVAGGSFATAAVLYLTTPKRKDAAVAPVIVAPMPLVGGGGAALEARF